MHADWSPTAGGSALNLRLVTKPRMFGARRDRQRSDLEGGGTAGGGGHPGGPQVGLAEVGVLGPPALAGLGEGVDRVVVLVGAGERLGVRGLDGGAVVLGPVGDTALGVVVRDLVDPPLADEGHVADDPRCGEA